MFALRGVAVSLSIFVVFYGALSLAVCGVWRKVWPGSPRYSARRCADLLFALRMIPFAVATGVTLTLAVPSFLLLEPRAVDEPMGAMPVMLGLCGMAMLLAGMWKAAVALVRASRSSSALCSSALAWALVGAIHGDNDSALGLHLSSASSEAAIFNAAARS